MNQFCPSSIIKLEKTHRRNSDHLFWTFLQIFTFTNVLPMKKTGKEYLSKMHLTLNSITVMHKDIWSAMDNFMMVVPLDYNGSEKLPSDFVATVRL